MTPRTNPSAVGRNTRPTALALRVILALAIVLGAGLVATPAAADPSSTRDQEWWIGTLGLEDVWQISKGAGVTVAVLDSGVDASIGDLKGAVVAGFDALGGGNGETDTDPVAHGTRMASEIAGRGVSPGVIGVAPQAKILPVVVPTSGIDDNTVTALNRLSAMAHPPQVVNMSYGAPVSCPAPVQAAVKKAVDRGMILVASAGNEGSTTNASQFPANCVGVIAVGAFGTYGQGGTIVRAWEDSQRQPYVTLAAPGIHMIQYVPPSSTARYGTGTSDAAAIVSGSIADVRSHFPTMSSRQIVARMIATARQFQGAQGTHNNVFGWGAARPHHALTDSVPANAPNPVYDALAKLGRPAHPTGPKSSAPAPGESASSQAGSISGAVHGSGKSSNTGVLIGVLVGALVIALIVIVALARGRRRAPLG